MEESGWKNVHGDVFRPPQYPLILSSLLGSGTQLFCMILIVICEYYADIFVFFMRAYEANDQNCMESLQSELQKGFPHNWNDCNSYSASHPLLAHSFNTFDI